jgi:hypothetical protein
MKDYKQIIVEFQRELRGEFEREFQEFSRGNSRRILKEFKEGIPGEFQ